MDDRTAFPSSLRESSLGGEKSDWELPRFARMVDDDDDDEDDQLTSPLLFCSVSSFHCIPPHPSSQCMR